MLTYKRTKLYKKDGITPESQHMDCMALLRVVGYDAEFAIGFDACKVAIDNYLKIGTSVSAEKSGIFTH
ncbi:MAG: hypothetical protein EXR21_09095 [Flavobacteriaceae bacterium]|nr:hypothetical protein [Flavobacteriaceae bacterium]